MEERLIQIETRLAYQELTIEQLNEALLDQQKEISLLKKQLANIEKALADTAEPGVVDISLETPPPHY